MANVHKLRWLNVAAAVTHYLLCVMLIVWLLVPLYEEPPVNELGASVHSLLCLLLVFTSITCLFHIIAAVSNNIYENNVKSGRNPMRWLEYSITATVMLLIIAITSGVDDTTWRVLICILSVTCIFCGYLSELPSIDKSMWAKGSITALGWVAMLGAYAKIGTSFYTRVNQSTQAGANIPGFVYAIVIVIGILYASFGGIHLVHLIKGRENIDTNINVEGAYVVDSLVSKVLLVGLLFGGIEARRQRLNEN